MRTRDGGRDGYCRMEAHRVRTYTQPELNRMWLDGNITREEYDKLSKQAAVEAAHDEREFLPEGYAPHSGWARPAMPVPIPSAPNEQAEEFWKSVGAKL